MPPSTSVDSSLSESLEVLDEPEPLEPLLVELDDPLFVELDEAEDVELEALELEPEALELDVDVVLASSIC